MVLQSEIRDHGEGGSIFLMSRTVEEEKEKQGREEREKLKL